MTFGPDLDLRGDYAFHVTHSMLWLRDLLMTYYCCY